MRASSIFANIPKLVLYTFHSIHSTIDLHTLLDPTKHLTIIRSRCSSLIPPSRYPTHTPSITQDARLITNSTLLLRRSHRAPRQLSKRRFL